MTKLLRRAATVVATAMLGAALVPATGAYAGPDALTPCDNIDSPSSEIVPDIPVVLPGDLGTITVHLASSQDSYVRYNGPGTSLDTVVGVDLQTISLSEDFAVCVRLPIAGNYVVLVNVSELRIQVCQYLGEPGPGTPRPCLVSI